MLFADKHVRRFFLHVDAEALVSHDDDTKVGAILVDYKTRDIIATGFNGFIRGANDASLPRTRPEKYPYMVHAETNLICNAARLGKRTEGGILFLPFTSCTHCSRMIYQAGIEVYYFKGFYRDFTASNSMLDLNQEILRTPDPTNPDDYGIMRLAPRKTEMTSKDPTQ